jgi:hypothetical protein
MTRPPRRPRRGQRVRPGRPVPAPDLAAAEAQLTAQLTRGAAHDVRLWWVCVGFSRPEGFHVASFAITTDPAGGVDVVGTCCAHRSVPRNATVLISSVQLDGLDDETLAAVLTLPRECFYGVVAPPLDPAAVPHAAPDAARVQAALAADIARNEPGVDGRARSGCW